MTSGFVIYENEILDVNSSTSSADVSILVTEPSPEVPVGPKINANQSLIHHVIVHRESEEYQTDYDETDGSRRTSKWFEGNKRGM